MKKAVKRTLIIVPILLVVLVVSAIGIIYAFYPRVQPAPDIQVSRTDTVMLNRGKYLVDHVALCLECHTVRDQERFLMPPKGVPGAGGEHFGHAVGFPGEFVSANITPFNLKNWTDGEIYRMMVQGITKDGQAAFPMMPFTHYSKMDSMDAMSIIAYIRTLPEDPGTDPGKSEIDFPVSMFIRLAPRTINHTSLATLHTPRQRGEYLVNMGGCMDCHTKVDKGEPIPELAFGGGREFPLPTGGIVRSVNITSHNDGIGTWTESQFIQHFRQYKNNTFPPVAKNSFNTIMGWQAYAGMSEGDLKDIFAYLKSTRPVPGKVEKFTP